jgi:hypothetical protein
MSASDYTGFGADASILRMTFGSSIPEWTTESSRPGHRGTLDHTAA